MSFGFNVGGFNKAIELTIRIRIIKERLPLFNFGYPLIIFLKGSIFGDSLLYILVGRTWPTLFRSILRGRPVLKLSVGICDKPALLHIAFEGFSCLINQY
jgi:hypothetical protein